jgi:DNA-binding phage protein
MSKANKYLEWIKQYDNMDRYILFLLSVRLEGQRFSVTQIAEITGMTRAHIYNVINRNTGMAKDFEAAAREAIGDPKSVGE